MERPPVPLQRKRRRVACDAAPTRESVLLMLQRCRPRDRELRAELMATYCRAWRAFQRLARRPSIPLPRASHDAGGAAPAPSLTPAPAPTSPTERKQGGASATVLAREVLDALARLRETVHSTWRNRSRQARSVLIDALLRQTETLYTDDDIPALVLWIYVLHDAALWWLGDVLVQLVQDDGEDADWWTLAVQAVLVEPARLPASTVGDCLQTPPWVELSSHQIAERLVAAVIDLAFDPAPPSEEAHRAHTAARRVLSRLGASATQPFCMHVLAVVTRVSARRLARSRDASGEASDSLESLRFFLRGQLETFLLATTNRQHAERDAVHQAAFLSDCLRCVALNEVADLVRQRWVDDRLQDDSTVRDRLADVISSCVQLEPELQRHLLALAHDLAVDALAQSEAALLRRTLELVACAAPSAYTHWCRSHLGAEPSTALSDDAAVHCLRAAAATSGGGGSVSAAHCSLVQSKRQLQFLVAFLLELDRPPTDDARQQQQQRRQHPCADHVLAHLSAVKTHQTTPLGATVGELLADFCSTTRLRHVQLQSREQHDVRMALSGTSTSSSSSSDVAVSRRLSLESSSSTRLTSSLSASSTSGTKATVREMVAAFRQHSTKLPSQVTQWRMFQPQAWRQQLLPCCLDVEAWTTESRDPQFLVSWLGLVQLLARHHIVSATDYAAFLGQVERWTELEQHRAQKSISRRRRARGCDDGVEWLRQLVERVVAIDQGPDALVALREAQWEHVGQAFVAAFEDIVDQRDEAQRDRAIAVVQTAVIDQLVTPSSSSADVLDRHVQLWVRLLSSQGDDTGIDPLARMAALEAYCRLLTVRLTSRRTTMDGAPSRVDLAAAVALGCLLGLLSSLPFCEQLAARWTREAEREVLGGGVVAVAVEPQHVHRAVHTRVALTSAFVGAFLRGLSTQSAALAQTGAGVLERVWTPELREFLVWLAHHVQWWGPAAGGPVDAAATAVVVELQSFRWFQATTSTADHLRSLLQWKRFWDLELHVTFDGPQDLSLVRRTRTRIETHVLSLRSAAGETPVKDALVWIAQAAMTTALAAAPAAPARLVALFQDLWTRQFASMDATVGALLQKLIESSLRLLSGSAPSVCSQAMIHVTIECLSVLLDTAGGVERRPRHATPLKTVIDWLDALARRDSDPNNASIDWTGAPLGVVLGHKDALSETAVFRLPSLCVLRWMSDWNRAVATVRAAAGQESPLLLLLASSRSFLQRLGVPFTGATTKITSPPSRSRHSTATFVRSQLGLFKWSLRLHLLQLPPIQANVGLHQRHERLASMLVSALCTESLATAAPAVATQCHLEWMAAVDAPPIPAPTTDESPDFDFQMVLLHVVASLCADVAPIARQVLAFQPPTASVSQAPSMTQAQAAPTADSHAWFVFFLASMALSLGRLDLLMAHHPSSWVNAVVDAACRLTEARQTSTLRVLAATDALHLRLEKVLERAQVPIPSAAALHP
ncbi:hypothetical protein P43SY_003734 [Pythium insidiosum]|uniref:Uncharacterized protein n=1 Tax=Pythium insidiosum TaxID=114742 RepID=A0AAD5LXD4_PYTIN|nr:hypothetical protein P43SY_003734 [Pythium insidiosum]